jgi:hypothetical protein
MKIAQIATAVLAAMVSNAVAAQPAPHIRTAHQSAAPIVSGGDRGGTWVKAAMDKVKLG